MNNQPNIVKLGFQTDKISMRLSQLIAKPSLPVPPKIKPVQPRIVSAFQIKRNDTQIFYKTSAFLQIIPRLQKYSTSSARSLSSSQSSFRMTPKIGQKAKHSIYGFANRPSALTQKIEVKNLKLNVVKDLLRSQYRDKWATERVQKQKKQPIKRYEPNIKSLVDSMKYTKSLGRNSCRYLRKGADISTRIFKSVMAKNQPQSFSMLTTRSKRIKGSIVPLGLTKLSSIQKIQSYEDIFRGKLKPHVKTATQSKPTSRQAAELEPQPSIEAWHTPT